MSAPAPLASKQTSRRRTLAERNEIAQISEQSSSTSSQAASNDTTATAKKKRGGTRAAKGSKFNTEQESVIKALVHLRELEDQANMLKVLHSRLTDQMHRLQVEDMILKKHVQSYEDNGTLNLNEIYSHLSKYMSSSHMVKAEPVDDDHPTTNTASSSSSSSTGFGVPQNPPQSHQNAIGVLFPGASNQNSLLAMAADHQSTNPTTSYFSNLLFGSASRSTGNIPSFSTRPQVPATSSSSSGLQPSMHYEYDETSGVPSNFVPSALQEPIDINVLLMGYKENVSSTTDLLQDDDHLKLRKFLVENEGEGEEDEELDEEAMEE